MWIRIWNRWFGEPLRRIEAESLAFRLSDAGRGLDVKTITVILVAAACLTIQNFAAAPDRLTPLCGFIAEQTQGQDARREVIATLNEWTVNKGSRLTWFGLCTIL